jgi:hypothetical protein
MMPPEQTERPRLRDGVHYVPTTFETRLRMMLIWEARQQARQAVIRKLKAEGRVRGSLLPSRLHDWLKRICASMRRSCWRKPKRPVLCRNCELRTRAGPLKRKGNL